MKNFAGKIAFITGGACGAGLAYAQLFAEKGMKKRRGLSRRLSQAEEMEKCADSVGLMVFSVPEGRFS